MSLPSLLKDIRENQDDRLKIFKASVLGKPYKVSPLSAYKKKELLKWNTNEFDCVTLVEHYLASLNSKNLTEYKMNLKKIRYTDSIVSWKNRKHYFSNWLSDNEKLGFIKKVTSIHPVTKNIKLDCVPGTPAYTAKIKYSLEAKLKEGDLISFVSSSLTLDYFHVGIVLTDKKILHATKSKGFVVEESLAAFLKRTDCIGFTVARIIY